jgi:hypothetical protein
MAGTTITEMMAVELGSTDTPDQATIAKLRDGSGIEDRQLLDDFSRSAQYTRHVAGTDIHKVTTADGLPCGTDRGGDYWWG